jgi:hypothetical protein
MTQVTVDISIFRCGHLERLPLGTSYPGIVAHVARLLVKLPAGTELVIDYTGVGARSSTCSYDRLQPLDFSRALTFARPGISRLTCATGKPLSQLRLVAVAESFGDRP